MKRTLLSLLICLALPAGCGTGGGPVEKPVDLAEEPTDAAADLGGIDLPVVPDVPEEERDQPPEVIPETASDEEILLECQPGEGCFLDKCTENADCQSAWCAEHLGAAVCTITCQEECPPGWSCRQVAETAPDVVYICVSQYSNLCKPCSTSNDCKSFGGADDVCVDYGTEGSFCGGACATTDDCPWGFTCKQVETVDGVLLDQCMADAGVCPCTDKSADLGLLTPCEVSNDFGLCLGKRVCTEQGLSDCDAEVPEQEDCNGLDDDCDGEVDDPYLVEGGYKNLCDDDDECTTDACLGESGCEHVALDEGECKDGNPCTVADHCVQGVCIGSPVECDDGNPCTYDTCDATGGCVFEPNDDLCDDGDPCTLADKCTGGECVGVAVECDCLSDDDCAGLEDGNLCNGTLYCNTDKLPYQCALVPDSPVECEELEQGSVCLKAWCNPDTGECTTAPSNEGILCDNGDVCTVGDTCSDGVCASGQPVNCNDGNPCTDDNCFPAQGCVHTDNGIPCSDGDVCTTGDYCGGGACKGGALLDCDDGNGCTKDSCDPEVGCIHETLEGECDDGNACTVGDHCAAGLCVAGGVIDCDDGNPCTADSCDLLGGCVHQIVAAPCDDGDVCTAGDECVNGECKGGPPLNCDDQNSCTDDFCNENGICIHSANDDECDDGNECTVDDHCAAAKCVALNALDCNDDSVCTTDSCDPLQGCVHTLNEAPCDDGDVCTIGDHCHLGKCIYSGTLTCEDSNPCTDDGCNPLVGCAFTPNNAACDDGSVCTVDDMCGGGLCVSGPALDCQDDNPCTDSACDPAMGCLTINNSDVCDDGDECTVNEICAAGVCGGGQQVNCNDGNVCTDDDCNPDEGCVYNNNGGDCSDGNVCTVDDKCSQGECKAGADLFCDDGSKCTIDSCDQDSGCVFTPLPDETPCGDNQWCQAGVCKTKWLCDPADVKFKIFTSSLTWKLPGDVEHVRVMVAGGGGGGAKGHGNGGGSGHVRKGEYDVASCDNIAISVGSGGSYDNNGAQSGFGAYLTANGGNAGHQNSSGSGAGGSGGGGAGNAGHGGNGGTGGSNGSPGATYSGGAGGNFDDVVSGFFVQATMSHGQGGQKGSSSHAGGGGGGGVLINGQGTGGGKGQYSWSAQGGAGYGGGGGGGGYNGPYANGGTGGKGVVYVEWD